MAQAKGIPNPAAKKVSIPEEPCEENPAYAMPQYRTTQKQEIRIGSEPRGYTKLVKWNQK